MERRLAAILAADVVGYTRLMEEDEQGTLESLRALRTSELEPIIDSFGGRLVKLMGDGLLVEFMSVVDAVKCALAWQAVVAKTSGQIQFRIGINIGDIVVEDDDIFGDGVNVAARLESLAEPGGICISDDARRQIRGKVDTQIDDLGLQKLKNVSEPVRVFRLSSLDTKAIAPNQTVLKLAHDGKPSVAVLPFQNMSNDPEQAYFSDGITDDIITDLSRYAALFVSARHSSFAYRDTATTPSQIARELGVQYIVEGSIRRSGIKARITARLFDPWSGNELWSERYDRELTEIFEVQDEITSLIVNVIVGEIERQHYRRSLAKNADSVNSYDHVLRALAYTWKFDLDGHNKAIVSAESALKLDAENARAHAMISWANLHFYTNALTDDPDGAAQRCIDAAKSAISADDREPWSHTVMAWVHQWLYRNTKRAISELERAVALNPSSVFHRSIAAFALTYAGKSDVALAELENAMRVNPHYPITYHLFCGRALFNLRRFPEAVSHLEPVRHAQPHHPNALAMAAAAYAANGQIDEANATAREIKLANDRFTFEFVSKILPFEKHEERDLFLTNLDRAGLD